MTESDRDKIQETAEKFSDAIKAMSDEKCRVAVFYMYLDEGEWCSGDAGNMNWLERLGASKRLLDLESDPEAKKF